MKLCFSSYAQILKEGCLNTVRNKELIQTLVTTIDPSANYLDNDTQVSRLFNGESNFPNSSIKYRAKKRDTDQPMTDIVEKAKKIDINHSGYFSSFENNVSKLIDSDKIETAVLSLLVVIENDNNLITEHNELFKRCTGHSPKIIEPFAKKEPYKFMAGVFLYIVLINKNYKDSIDKHELDQKFVYKLFQDDALDNKPNVEKYLDRIIDEFKETRTMLYSETPVPFYDFYVQNDFSRYVKVSSDSYRTLTYSNCTPAELRKLSPYIIIKGTGGLGKSMMMRHLLLFSAKECRTTKLIPLFIQLKNYDRSEQDVMQFMYEEIEQYWPCFDIKELESCLEEGQAIVLLDGLDELKNTVSDAFQSNLAKLIARYPQNQYIISSRPFSNFSIFSRFTVLNLNPFTKSQGLELIDKLHFRDDKPEIKQKFRKEFDTKLFYTHSGFSDNPLLLTIMLMTYAEFAEVPSKMHLFYQEAYMVLAKKHDASKGGFKRALETGVSADDFADIFARFCAESYRDQKYEFSYFDLVKYFKSLKNKYSLDGKSVDNFIFDVCNNLCLMYLDGERYSFVHRSFQEYFCARYFASQRDKHLDEIGKMLDKNKLSRQNDSVLSMLYDMIPKKVTEYMIVPYMERLINESDSKNGFWTFMDIIYSNAEMGEGEVDDLAYCAPTSPIYGMIIETFEIEHEFINPAEVEDADLLNYNDYYSLDETDGSTVVEYEIPQAYIDEYGEPTQCGRIYTLDWDYIYTSSLCEDLRRSITSLSFPLYKEYVDFKNLYIKLQSEMDSKDKEDLFDMLD